MVPSYLLLKRLVETRLPEILRQESCNTDRVHLYDTGEYWTAFDRSAYVVKRACPDFPTFVLSPAPGAPPTVVAVSVPASESSSCRSLAVPPLQLRGYEAWHRSELNKYKLK